MNKKTEDENLSSSENLYKEYDEIRYQLCLNKLEYSVCNAICVIHVI